MEEEQKVYIKGNPNRGDEVIKLLTDLGGRNIHHHTGNSKNTYYYIDPNGIISVAAPDGNVCYPFLREFYKEISLERWKPEYQGQYYFIDIKGGILQKMWFDTQVDNLCYKFGNCFRTQKEAEIARDKIKELLNNKA